MNHATMMPLEVLWKPRTIISALLAGEALALILSLSPGASEQQWVHFGLASLMIQWITLLTFGSLLLLRNVLKRLQLGHLSLIVVLLILTCGWLVGGAAWTLFDDAWPLSRDSALSYFLRLTGICLTVGLLTMAALQNHWRVKLLATRAKQAELESLQARTHPHFLFNTLNTAAALVHARPDAAEALLLDLADLFRAALSGPRNISLEEELDLARRYLSIEQLRLGERLSVSWELPTPLPATSLPALTLQPLVENAVRHGIELIEGGGRIDILVTADGDTLSLAVRNDLPRAGAGNGNPGHGVGLASVRLRIDQMTDGLGKVDTEVINDRHVAMIQVPLARPDLAEEIGS